jgi:hypothetical protein
MHGKDCQLHIRFSDLGGTYKDHCREAQLGSAARDDCMVPMHVVAACGSMPMDRSADEYDMKRKVYIGVHQVYIHRYTWYIVRRV